MQNFNKLFNDESEGFDPDAILREPDDHDVENIDEEKEIVENKKEILDDLLQNDEL